MGDKLTLQQKIVELVQKELKNSTKVEKALVIELLRQVFADRNKAISTAQQKLEAEIEKLVNSGMGVEL